jgi:hypothetical protein
MATYYVRTDGNDSNTGLAQGTAFAWQSINKALSASGMASGDTVYIAPGVYSTQITVGMTSATTTTTIMGNPTASLFTGVTAGPVIVTNYNPSLSGVSFGGIIVNATSKNNLSWNKILFKVQNSKAIQANLCRYWSFTDCFFHARTNTVHIQCTPPLNEPFNYTFLRCIFKDGYTAIEFFAPSSGTSRIADTTSITLCVFDVAGFCTNQNNTGGFTISNCYYRGTYGVYTLGNSTSFITTVKNCILTVSNEALRSDGVVGTITEDYNRVLSGSYLNVSPSIPSNSSTTGDVGVDFGESVLFGLPSLQPLTSYFNSINKQFGTSVNAPTNDIYGVAWTGTSPDAGVGTYRLMSTVSPYNPTERNSSAITIVPGSTGQSIELYLGATGLTATTAGLTATYNRTRSNRVPITLVNLTYMTDSWVSGGFKEVDASTMPGVYRLDLPNAAVAVGADDVTVVVKGAAGTNGAVMTIKLLSVASDILSADLGSGTNAGTLNERTVRSALRSLRNKVAVASGTMTVYKENDADTAWTGSLSNTSDVTVDPS